MRPHLTKMQPKVFARRQCAIVESLTHEVSEGAIRSLLMYMFRCTLDMVVNHWKRDSPVDNVQHSCILI
jgi:hypothetical protein